MFLLVFELSKLALGKVAICRPETAPDLLAFVFDASIIDPV
jgi:hypothetical protein